MYTYIYIYINIYTYRPIYIYIYIYNIYIFIYIGLVTITTHKGGHWGQMFKCIRSVNICYQCPATFCKIFLTSFRCSMLILIIGERGYGDYIIVHNIAFYHHLNANWMYKLFFMIHLLLYRQCVNHLLTFHTLV